MTPEEKARAEIDQLLKEAGWAVQDYDQFSLGASLGVAVREFPLTSGLCRLSSLHRLGGGGGSRGQAGGDHPQWSGGADRGLSLQPAGGDPAQLQPSALRI